MNRIALTSTVVGLLLMATACRTPPPDSSRAEGHGEEAGEASAEPEKGPHGGRMLREGSLALEVTIFERGVPPEFRVFPYENDAPIDPADVKLTIALHRFGGRVDTIRFSKRDDHLLGDATVEEPHSFDVEVTADYRGRAGRWTYPSPEGRTEMSPAAVASSGIEIETVGTATIRSSVQAAGRIVPNAEHVAHVVPRYPGLVKAVRANLGDRVAAGHVLAIVENNDSLQSYDVKAAIAGTIVAKDVIVGEIARDGDVLFTIVDLGTVWVDLRVAPADAARVRPGQPVTIAATQGDERRADGRVVYVAPIGTAETQTLLVRAELSNPEGTWTPGLYVTGEVVVAEDAVPAAVKASALQTYRDWDVVFLSDGTVFQAMPVEIGKRDAEWAEIVGGVTAGQRYVTENSFVVKADIGKSGASHDH